MNNILKSGALVLLIIPSVMQAMSADEPNQIKLRGSAFIPQSKKFRNIYGKAAGAIELEYVRFICEHISFWANVDGLFKHGHSIGFCSPTKIGVANFSFGLDFPWEICDRYTIYFGLGPSIGAVHLNNESVCCSERITKAAAGFVVKTGLDIAVCDYGFIELFVDYIFERAFFHERVDVSGLRPGLGLGIKF